MNADRVRELIAAYGGDHRRWPAAEREAALSLLQRMADLRDEADRMAALDAALDRWLGPARQGDAASLARRVSASPQRAFERRAPLKFRWPGFAWPNMAGLAAAAFAGFLVGWSELGSELLANGQADSVDRQAVASIIEDATW